MKGEIHCSIGHLHAAQKQPMQLAMQATNERGY